jgi:hypothetical protein
LVKGSWSVSAQNIYLDDVLNPNGVFNDSQNNPAGAHYFNYDANASLSLNAPNGAIEITGGDVPLLPASSTGLTIPVLLPPSLQVTAGNGGLTLATHVILFPSPNQNLDITTLNGGGFEGLPGAQAYDINIYDLIMSDSAQKQWSPLVGIGVSTEIFGYSDHASTPPELNNPNSVQIKVSGDMNNVNVYADLPTTLNVNGNMFNSGFVGENLHTTDTTAITVGGNVSFSPVYTFVSLTQPLSADWQAIFYELVDPASIAISIPATEIGNPSYLKTLAASDLVFSPSDPNPGFVYDPTTKQLGFAFQMSGTVHSALDGTLDGHTATWEAIVLNSSGTPETQQGTDGKYYFVTTTVTPFASPSVIDTLFGNSLGLTPGSHASVPNSENLPVGFQIGGPGKLTIDVLGSMDLGATAGILSWGGADGSQSGQGISYAPLESLTGNSGAQIDLTVGGTLGMLTSTIASVGGGDVTVSSGGEINLGLGGVALNPLSSGNLAYGIYTAGAGNVKVTADGSINIDTARIGAFNGGNVTVVSTDGDVNAGNGVNQVLQVPFYYYDSETKMGNNGVIQGPRPYGSGILAISPTKPYQISPGTAKGGGELPGNITVDTPNGNIVSTLGGIAQFALNGNVAGGPTVNLTAGTVGVKATTSQGNINLGQGGVIGGSVALSAQGSVDGLIISRQNTTVTAVQNVNVTVLAGGSANVSAGGSLSGTLVGVGGINASGGSISATMLSSSVSANGGAAQNSLGAATASTASQSAANQSNNEAKQEVASDSGSDDDQKKKKSQSLLQRVKRVTVILPKT